LLVPTERHVEAAAQDGAEALTVRRLVADLAARERPDATPTTPEMTRLWLARALDLPIGRARPIDDALGLLRRAGTRPESLRATGLERGKLLADLLERADVFLADRRLWDDRQSAWLATRALREPVGSLLPGGRAVLSGLTRWDASTIALAEALHARLVADGGAGLTVELALPEGGPLEEPCSGLLSELEARWGTLADPPGLAPRITPIAGGRASVISAHDAASEARVVTREVLEALERGTPLDAIAVVPVELSEAFLEPLRFELTRAGLPFVEPRGRPAIAAPRAHAALELLGLARGPLARDALIDVLRTPGLRLGDWFGASRRDLAELCSELALLPLNVGRSPAELVRELEDRLLELERLDRPSAGRLRATAQGLSAFLDALCQLAAPASRAEHATRVEALLDRIGLLELPVDALRESVSLAALGRPELLTALGSESAAARALATAIERTRRAATALGIEDPVSLTDYLEELDLALEGATPTRGAARAAAIRVARPEDVSGLDLDFVVLCQASDQVLDRGDSVDPVIGAELFARLSPSERPVSGGERRSLLLAVGSVLAHATRIAVTFPTHEGTSTLGPSRLALWLAARGAPFRREPASPLAAGARRTRPLPVPGASARRRTEIEIERQRFYAVPGTAPGPYTGAVGSLEAHVPASDERPVAVTALERTLRCGFLGFMNVLRASREDPVGDAIGARERGNLLHGALSAALEATRALAATHTPSELEARALEAARAFLEQRGKSPLRRAGLVATLWDVRAILRVTFQEAVDVHFHAAEVGFGGRDAWPALALGPFRVSGRADRIDASTDKRRVRVIDYKTNLPRSSERELELQPFLYAHKCGVELGARSVEFAYFGLNRRAPELRTVYEGPIESDDIADAFARAEAALLALREGRLAPVPASRTFCTRCSARDACRRPLSAPDPNSEGSDA